MNTLSCQSPIAWDTLLAYWLGELGPESEARIEEHYLGCAGCSGRLQQVMELAQNIRTLVQTSAVNMVVSEDFVQRLLAHGVHVREYHVPLNGSVNCTVTPDDDIVVAHLEAPLADVARLDMVSVINADNHAVRYEDIPFNADSGAVVYAARIDTLRSLSKSTLQVRLLAVDAGGEHTLGEYTFIHTPAS